MRHLTRGSGRGEATSALGERGRAGLGGRGFARGAWGEEAGVGEREGERRRQERAPGLSGDWRAKWWEREAVRLFSL